MPIKSYEEMRKVDVAPFVEKRDGNDYLNWAKCKELLHQNGAEVVYFEPCVNENGSSLFMSDVVFGKDDSANRCYEVRVHIVIDDLEFDAQYPLMNGKNPVRDNSMSQQRVWNAQTRAFVKGVAMRTGLGFGLWLKNMDDFVEEDDLSKHNILKIKERCQQRVTYLLEHKKTVGEITTACGFVDEEAFRAIFAQYKTLHNFEANLCKMIKELEK